MRSPGAALALALAAGAVLAQEETELAPESAPTPEARPQEAAPAEAEPAEDALPQLIPPEDMRAGEPGEGPSLIPPEEMGETPAEEPAEEAGETAALPMREALSESEADLAACLSALDEVGVAYARAEPIEESETPDCGIANPVTVTEVAPGVTLEPAATLRCEAALAAARWVADTVLPLSRKLEDRGPLLAIDQGTAYLCRPRADGKLSEHAFGNALDVSGFRFAAGDPIPVQPRAGDGTLEEAFQDAVRAGACLDFTTVLGPGSDEDHAEHLHLDVKARERGFRICE